MWGMKSTTILETEGEGIVRLAKDTVTNSHSIGLRTSSKMEWKHISEELYDLLVEELELQEGNKKG